jgi:hypothetical protein
MLPDGRAAEAFCAIDNESTCNPEITSRKTSRDATLQARDFAVIIMNKS